MKKSVDKWTHKKFNSEWHQSYLVGQFKAGKEETMAYFLCGHQSECLFGFLVINDNKCGLLFFMWDER